MSDDPTQRHDTPAASEPAAGEPGPDAPVEEAPPSDVEPAAASEPAESGEPSSAGAPPPGPTRRRTAGWRGPLIVVAAFAAVVIAGAALATRMTPPPPVAVATPSPEPLTSDPESGLLATRPEIEQRVAWARAGIQPFAAALDQLIADADARLGDVPSPREPLDIRDTGGPFVDDSASAYGLALAYVATGDARYAKKAADFLRAWSTTTKSTLHTCPADGDCQTSLIIGRTAPAFVFAAELIAPSGAMSTEDSATFDDWLRTVILPTASERDNNWGDAGTFMRLAIGSYLGDAATFDGAVVRWRQMMDLVPAEGYIPEEVRRGSSGISYSQEAIQYKVASAVIAARRDVDLWSYRGADGGTLKGAVDYLARFADPNARWPWHPSATFPTPSPIWENVYAHWTDPRYLRLVTSGRPFGDAGHSAIRWTTITAAAPPPGVAAASAVASESPVASASTAAAPTASPTPAPTPAPTPTPEATPSAPDPTVAPLDSPVVALQAGAYRDLRRLPVLVDWKKSRAADVRRYQVERLDDGRRTDRVNVAGGDRTAIDDQAPTGVDLVYQVRVSVRGAGTSDWAGTPLHLRFVDDADPRVSYKGAWHTAGHPDYERDQARWSVADGATASIDFDGTSIAWLGPVGANRGRAVVRLDGKRVGTVDLDASTFEARRVLFVAHADGDGAHRLTVEVQGSGRAVVVDGFVVMAPR